MRAAFPRAADRPVGRQAVPAARGGELHARRRPSCTCMLQFSVLPGHENDWSLVQVALTDITARKKAEAYLEYLGKHDVLTKLYNRSFYVDELNRLERKGPLPGHGHHGRSQRAEGRQRPARPRGRRRAAAPRRRGARQGGRQAAHARRASAATSSRCCCPGTDERTAEAGDREHPEPGRAQQPVLFRRADQFLHRRSDRGSQTNGSKRWQSARTKRCTKRSTCYHASLKGAARGRRVRRRCPRPTSNPRPRRPGGRAGPS